MWQLFMFQKMGFRISCVRPNSQRKNSLRKALNESQTSLILLRGRGFVVETLILRKAHMMIVYN